MNYETFGGLTDKLETCISDIDKFVAELNESILDVTGGDGFENFKTKMNTLKTTLDNLKTAAQNAGKDMKSKDETVKGS